jgi:hypothetical protein
LVFSPFLVKKKNKYSDMSDVENAYDAVLGRFMALKNVRTRNNEIVGMLLGICEYWSRKRSPSRARKNIFLLKRKLDTQFSVDVKCQYVHLITPTAYGCDLRELLYNREDVASDVAVELLAVFARQAAGLASREWHVLTDIDDTVYPNTERGSFIAGSDVAWHQKVPYPGVVAFYAALHSLPTSTGLPAYSTVLSATPGALKGHKLKDARLATVLGPRYGFLQGFDRKRDFLAGVGDMATTFVTGSVRKLVPRKASVSADGKPAAVNGLNRDFGAQKFRRFQQYTAIFPEYAAIFIGDNGQGDVVAGLHMLATNPRCLVCIRCVCQTGVRYTNFRLPEVPGVVVTDAMRARLFPFRTYLDLARVFVHAHIFSPDDAAAVEHDVASACAEPKNAAFAHLYPLEPANYTAWLHKQRRNIYFPNEPPRELFE